MHVLHFASARVTTREEHPDLDDAITAAQRHLTLDAIGSGVDYTAQDYATVSRLPLGELTQLTSGRTVRIDHEFGSIRAGLSKHWRV